jgi:hypothetical protein
MLGQFSVSRTKSITANSPRKGGQHSVSDEDWNDGTDERKVRESETDKKSSQDKEPENLTPILEDRKNEESI